MMFALDVSEVVSIALWLAGIGASIYVAPMLSHRRRRIGLIAIATLLPLLGTLVALAVTCWKLWARHPPNSARRGRLTSSPL